jgi:two-component system response regulator FlrC
MPERVSAAPDVGSGDGAQEPDRILIVEDDQDILDGLTEILESEGYGVVCAHNGREALECIKRVRPSVVLLDLTMPMMDGAQFLERIRLKREFAELPIVLISADGNLREKARSLGVSRYLEKPIQIAALLDAVKAFRGNARGS